MFRLFIHVGSKFKVVHVCLFLFNAFGFSVFGHTSHLCLVLLSYELICLSCWFWFRFSGESVSLVSLLSWADAVTGRFAPHMAPWQWHVSLVPAEITKMLTELLQYQWYQCRDPMAFSVKQCPVCLSWRSSASKFFSTSKSFSSICRTCYNDFSFPWKIPRLGKIRFILIATSAKIVNLSGRIKDSCLGPRSRSLHRSSTTWTTTTYPSLGL